MKIPVGVSNRHVHLTKETLYKLFKITNLEKKYDLNQPGEFASTLKLSIKVNDKIIENVRIVGKLREYDQVEIIPSDASYLGVNPPYRKSGDVKGSLPVTLIGPFGFVNLKEGLILAERHIHMGEIEASKLNLKDEELVKVYKDGKEIFKAAMKLKEPSYVEMHIDIDDAKDFDIKQNDEVEFCK